MRALRRAKPQAWGAPTGSRLRWYTVAFAAGAAGALLALAPLGWVSGSVAGAVLVAGWVVGTLQSRSVVHELSRCEDYAASHQQFNADLAPVWTAQIETSRQHMEGAISALTGQFSGIVDKLDNAVRVSNSATQSVDQGEGSLVSVFARSERDLAGVVANLEAANAGKAEMVEQVHALAKHIDALRDMAADVALIAAQTNLLAINAAIQAAHAGEHGRGFSVVAQEVRKLSKQSGDTGRRIAEIVERVGEAITATRTAADASAERDRASTDASRESIDGVLTGFRGITDSLVGSTQQLQEQSRGIQTEIADALVHLQFQDRVAQILAHVKQNIELAPTCLAEHHAACKESRSLEPVSAKPLLTELEKTYAMAEERQVHSGGGSKASSAPAETEITFF